MIILCQTCSAAYEIPPDVIAEGECQLRCVGCGDLWGLRIAEQSGALEAQGDASAVFPPRAREKTQGPRPRRLRKALAAAALLAAMSGAIGERAAIVAHVPAAGRLYALAGLPVNPLGLDLTDVSSSLTETNSKKIMLVEGVIVNLRDAETVAPPIRVALRSADGVELYYWTAHAGKARLAPHERLAFQTRLAAPPDGARDVLVKFVDASNTLALNPSGS